MATASGPVTVGRGELGYVDSLHNGTGSVQYVLPTELDAASYKSVVVRCRQVRVLVTLADLR